MVFKSKQTAEPADLTPSLSESDSPVGREQAFMQGPPVTSSAGATAEDNADPAMSESLKQATKEPQRVLSTEDRLARIEKYLIAQGAPF